MGLHDKKGKPETGNKGQHKRTTETGKRQDYRDAQNKRLIDWDRKNPHNKTSGQ